MVEIREFWQIIISAVVGIVWLVRLESKVGRNMAEIQRLETQLAVDRINAKEARAETNDLLREVQRDVKMLLGRGQVQHFTERTTPPR